MLNIENTKKYEITKTESYCLMFTSTLNLLPIIYALHKRLMFYGITSFGTGIFSVLYWRYPIHGWRRTLDIYYAKYTFLVYLGGGLYYIPYGVPSALFYSGASLVFILYYMTYVYPHIWIRFHITFHLFSLFMKLYILFYIHQW